METQNPILELEQQASLKSSGRGGRIALEDKALEAYHEALDSGLSKEEATKQYFQAFKTLNHETLRTSKCTI
jgi:hypothetical protein